MIAVVLRKRPAIVERLRTKSIWSSLAISSAYIVLYLALDRVSFIWGLRGIDVAPWNPPPGLTLTLLVVKGLRYIPAVGLAALLSDLLFRQAHIPLAAVLSCALILAAVYAGAATVLRRMLRLEMGLQRVRDVLLLILVTVVAAGAVSFGFVVTYVGAGIISWTSAPEAASRLWAADAIGPLVLTPALLVLLDRGRRGPAAMDGRDPPRHIETVAQLASIAGVLMLVFRFSEDYSVQLIYLLFLPVVWIATRRGLSGASWAVLAVQAGLMVAFNFEDKSPETVRSFQLLMFALATTGLLLGAAVREIRNTAGALADSENRLSVILDTARDGVLTIDALGRIESVNRAVEQLFAVPAQLLLNRNIHEFIDAKRLLEFLASMARAPASGLADRELHARRADGTLFPIELTVGRFGEPGKERYTLVIRDVFSRRQAEARARERQSELAHVSRLSLAWEMASGLAHELNQPLTAIAAYGRGCLWHLRQTPSARMKEGIEKMVQQAERAGDIISRLREFVQTGSTQRSLVAVETLIEDAVALVQIDAAQSKTEIEIRIASDLPLVRVDGIQIEQVLVNLMRNGMDAMVGSGARRRALTIEAKRTAERTIEITVADTGPGVVEEVAERLFEPFVTTKQHGMGLGLSISRSIIEAHDGRLKLIRHDGAGAAFTFELPVNETEVSGHEG